ncbi:H+-ATPase G subunit-domain-containing protein [Jimgerdemannia flammicorona]|uniref:V-type proton ATPase subunit G n=1 Tax=Jimgerdemannia flammicorona TaxID=994334 RepID=A0A433QL01_9FUNG|nr:H+-ATPase G subunit-domain-containing protein [Jimgerdemannia flammicorona]
MNCYHKEWSWRYMTEVILIFQLLLAATNYNEGRELFRSRAMTIFRPTFSLSLLYTHTHDLPPILPTLLNNFTMAASNSQGIQTLLEAEKEAAKIVQKAKQFRTERLKAARTEAAKEIDTLKAQKNAEYQAFDTEHSGEADQLVAKVSQETEAKLIEVQTAFAQNKEIVIAKLLETMTNVQPAVHVNAKARS